METFLYRTLEIENFEEIIQELKSYFLNFPPDNLEYFNHVNKDLFFKNCPITDNYFETNSLKIKNIASIVIPPNANGTAHTDTQQNVLALNFPVEDCENSYTSLYRVDAGIPKVISLLNGLTHCLFDHCKLTEIGRFSLIDRAVLFNTKVPHRVFNLSNQNRKAVSFRFVKDPWFLIR